MDSLFKFETDLLGFEVEGSEEYVRGEIERFLPFLRNTVAGEKIEEEDENGLPSLPAWYRKNIPPGRSPTMQDHILIFAYYLHKVRRQFIFTPDDMKSAFLDLDRVIPKSLLQIMGSLKRDHNLLWPGDKRGEYCLLPSGIQHVEDILGIEREARPEPPPEAAVERFAAAAAPPSDQDPAHRAARARLDSIFIGEQTEETTSSGSDEP